jgi:hypothetical protein
MPIPSEAAEDIRALRAQGHSINAIARMLGLTRSSLQKWFAREAKRAQVPREMSDMIDDAADDTPADMGTSNTWQGGLPQLTRPEYAVNVQEPIFTDTDVATMRELIAWWQHRQQQQARQAEAIQTTQRITYHVDPRWIQAIEQEANDRDCTIKVLINQILADYFTSVMDANDQQEELA